MARTFAPHIVTPDSALGGKKIEKSLTFDENNQTTLICNLGSSGDATNRKKTTLSFWIKLLRPKQGRGVITAAASGTGASATGTRFHLNSDGTWKFATQVSNSTVWAIDSDRIYTDTNAWYHVVMQLDTTQSTASNRVKIYVNGNQDTTFSGSYPSQNYDDYWSFGNWRIGDYGGDYGYYYGSRFMIADIYLLDGQSLDPTYFAFTETQTGIWTPKDYTGAFGDHGFHLEFKDDSAATATTMGKDTSGNANNFTPSNFSASGDGKSIKTDTPTNNKPIINGLLNWTYDANGDTLREGNLKLTGSQGWKNISTFKIDGTEKLYYEFVNTTAAGWQCLGILVITKGDLRNLSSALTDSRVYGFASTQATYFGGSYTSTSDVPSWSTNDVMSIKYEKGILRLYKNGALATAAATGIDQTKEIYAYIANDNASTPVGYVRFDKDSWTQSANAGVDYTWQLSETGLVSNPTLIRPQRHFDTVTFTGNGSTGQSITSLEFQPDLIWLKNRSATNNHAMVNSVVGRAKGLYPDSNSAEFNSSTGRDVASFDISGFTVGEPEQASSTNNNGSNIVAWCWKAGGSSTVTNNDGNNTSQVSVNAEAGFSILTYTGNGTNNSNITMGHGLGKKPGWVIIKNRDSTADFVTWITGIGGSADDNQKNLGLNVTSQAGQNSDQFRYTDSSVIAVRSTDSTNGKVNKNGDNYVAFCWIEIPGYSKFGIYTGNGSTDGPMVDLGFRPAYILLKRADGGAPWRIFDNKRPDISEYNNNTYRLHADDTTVEATSIPYMDFLSNGFKIKDNGSYINGSGNDYVYATFAAQPGLTPYDIFATAR